MNQKNIFLLLGSNLSDRVLYLSQCIDSINSNIGKITKQSKIYETAPWGKSNQPPFLNQALQVASTLSPEGLLSAIHAIEQSMGRRRAEKWGERIIDIDIAYYGDAIIRLPDLVIPHAHLAERRFALIPLTEISPDFIHPKLQKSNAQLLLECKDVLPVREFIG